MSAIEGPTGEDARGPGKKFGPVEEYVLKGPRAEFLARVQRLADMMLEQFSKASNGKDVDDKETRMLGGEALKVLGLWEKALHGGQPAAQLESPSPGRKKIPDPKKEDD